MYKILYYLNFLYTVLSYNIVHNVKPINKKSILFFPAKLKQNMPNELYSNFLFKLGEQYEIYIGKDNMEENKKLIQEIPDNENLCIVSHSSSANDAIELSEDVTIKKLVLIDPIEFHKKNEVSNPLSNLMINADEFDNKINDFLEADKIEMVKNAIWKKKENKEDNINLNNISNVLILKNKISEKWRFIPPIPPIDYLSIDIDNIKSDNKNITNLDFFGHFDILDSPWANFAHKTVSKGNQNRENSNIEEYHKYLVNLINDFNL
jgi:hypothetical protein